MSTTIHDILEEFKNRSLNMRDLGDKFERLMKGYFRTDPMYRDRFSDVWMWTEWPDHDGADDGIDLVAKEKDGSGYCAIQCKFYNPDHQLAKGDIDSFFTASGKKPFTSRIIVSTTDKWSSTAEKALKDQIVPVSRIRVGDLENSPVDWSNYRLDKDVDLGLKAKKQLFKHQSKALDEVEKGFSESDRGKMIMACGTGKTYTSLKIVEHMLPESGLALFLVPSIALLSQTLREWTAEADRDIHPFAVCSDTKVGKRKTSEDIEVHDLPFPATTDGVRLVSQVSSMLDKPGMTIVFSTYQSIQAIHEAQKLGLPKFDMIICDEAHRTTGVTLVDEDESHFVKVHDNEYVQADRRLYMTATPRVYGDQSKTKAQDNDALLCSMDDVDLFGPEFHRLGFSSAVGQGLLCDYKVLVLAVDEGSVDRDFQSMLADENHELRMEDAAKIVGCWNGLSKRFLFDDETDAASEDENPMRRAVAFSNSIKDSERITKLFADVVDQYRDEDGLTCEIKHVDGTQSVLERNEKLDWLKASAGDNMCRILSNARCLSEGVDVPSLDAVMFLNPRGSEVDIVQSVGRVMRRSPGKKFGYIILPVSIAANLTPEEALKDHKRYDVVWKVLQALRSHDDRFNSTINKIDLNKNRPKQIQLIGVGDKDSGEGAVQLSLMSYLGEWKDAIFAKIVKKCGDRRYWDSWAKDVADIAGRHKTRIENLLEDEGHRKDFDKFLKGLHQNINPSISEEEAIEMLSQHLITKPVFDALFEGYEFTKQNPVSKSMQAVLDLLENQALEKETESLEKFYASVRERASGIDNAEGKQKIILELYDTFFKTAFPRMTQRLGIVYTPVQVVDFILHSADYALKKEFGRGLTDENVHILDPFTGTGTFMTRLLQSGLIKPEDLERKYKKELHANEIVLLAYYIAAINIEETYHALAQADYESFEGIVLTDTFQIYEDRSAKTSKQAPALEGIFPENSERVKRQQRMPIEVIIGNPPYSAGQTSENDDNQNLKYPVLDAKIEKTYVERSTATLRKNLYDSYVRAIRWASDRIKNQGIVCYVTNGSFIDGNAMDGLRKCLADDFSSIYCFNLRGNQRTSGEISRKEGGKIFGSGSRAPIAITIMVKTGGVGKCTLHYHDIGDYLSQEDKFSIISDFASIRGIEVANGWTIIKPNKHGDWINQRDASFEKFIPMGDKKSKGKEVLFTLYSQGVLTSRDAWSYNFSKNGLESNMRSMIDFYSAQVQEYKEKSKANPSLKIQDVIDNDKTKISWSGLLKNDAAKGRQKIFHPLHIVECVYRPFCKQWLYFDRSLIERVYQMPSIFPYHDSENLVVGMTGRGATKEFSPFIMNRLPDYESVSKAQFFPLFRYEKTSSKGQGSLIHTVENGNKAVRKDNISDEMLSRFKNIYPKDDSASIKKEDIFYYVYGLLHSKEYQSRFEADLGKGIPRIPFAKDFWAFSKAGRELAHWHLDYEAVEPFNLDESDVSKDISVDKAYRVEKMRYGKKDKKTDTGKLVYNKHVTLSGIPEEAQQYIVNGKPAIDWLIDRYKVTVDKHSKIKNDPNTWSDDPRYIIDLVKRVVRVSVETVRIVNGLPAIEELDV
ncbi:DEAD/DEAH box helicase [Desulfovibrio sp. Fe33]|uniref:DEAD/DEAH box helicase n=1 Tax=Desulfovibrio sp. Fe33 TaxID=3020842 RepID=UPI00234E35AB|nr:type ISP restriction/modification enzyme [Desulfovibrio sp. Fe33]